MSIKDTDESKVTGTEVTEEAAPAKKNFKKLKYGTMFYTTIALVAAIVVVFNIMAGIMAKRKPMKLDITPDSRYELTEQSVDALKRLTKDVDIVVTSERDYFEILGNTIERQYAGQGIMIEIPFEIIPELLDKYSVYAEQGKGSINVKYVDMDKDPDIVNKYKKYYTGDIESGSIIISSGEKVRVLGSSDIMNMIAADNSTMSFQFVGESAITSAILNVTDVHPVKVAFAKTMNGASMFDVQLYSDSADVFEKELLDKNGYECTDFDIATDELDPEAYEMVVVYAPSVDFTENVINKLDEFLKNGGKYDRNMIYVPDYSKTSLPNIEAFLADWSVKVENSIIVDSENAIGSSYTTIMLEISDTEAVGELSNDKLPIVAPFTRELTKIEKKNEDVVKSVISSFDTSYTVELDDKNAKQGKQGARTAVMLSQKERTEGIGTVKSGLLVVGSPYMFDRTVIQQNITYNNGSVLLNILNNMSGKESGVIVPDKVLQQSFITTTAKQAKVIQIIVIWIIPIIVAAIGVIVLLRRRNK